MDQEEVGDDGRPGVEPVPESSTVPESGSPAVDLRPAWAVPGVDRRSVLAEGFEQLQAGLAWLRAVGASGWCVDDVTVRDGVRDLDVVRQQVEHVWLGLVHELDRRPGVVPGSRVGGVARRFLTGGLNKSPGQARRDVAAARALFRPDPDRPEDTEPDPDPDPEAVDPANAADPGNPGDPADPGDLVDAADEDGCEASLERLTDPRARLVWMGAAFEAGHISREHLDAGVECLRQVPRHLARAVDPETGMSGTQRVDEFMTGQAYRFDPRTLHGLARHLLAVLDPEGVKTGFDPDAYLRRDLRLIPAPDGMTIIRGQVDAAAAVWLKAALDHYSSPERNPEPDNGAGAAGAGAAGAAAAAADSDGELPLEVKDERTPGQRSADALIAIARRALDTDDTQVRREPAHVLILTDPDQLADAHTRTPPGEPADLRDRQNLKTTIEDAATRADSDRTFRTAPDPAPPPDGQAPPPGDPEPAADHAPHDPKDPTFRPRFDRAVGLAEIAKHGPVPPDVLALLTCDALLQAVVLGPGTGTNPGALLNLSTPQRTATRAQRRALAARDKGCVIPGCPAKPADCDAHHITYWSAGGKTTLTNLALACNSHHTEIHLGLWIITLTNGVPHVQVPDWHHLASRPGNRITTTRNPFHDAITRARQIAQQMRLNLHPPDETPGHQAA